MLTFTAPSSGGVLSWGQIWLFNSGTFGTQSPHVYVNPVINSVSMTATVGSGGSNFPVFASAAPVGAPAASLESWECNANASTALVTTPGSTYTIVLQFRFVTGQMSSTNTSLVNRFISFQPSFR